MKSNPYQSLLVIVVGFLLLAYLFPGGRVYLTGAATAIALLGLVSGVTRGAILWVWEKLALVLGWINSRIILSLVFIVFLVPIGFLFKLFKGDLLFLNRPPGGSVLEERNHTYTAEDLENPW